MPAQESIIEARKIEKVYTQPDGKRVEVIASTDLTIFPNQIVALLGPSGSGKSTLMRMLTGLIEPSSGEVCWHGKPLGNKPPNVAIVFQSFALFPWLTVQENVEAVLKARGISAEERRQRAMKTLDMVGLDGFETAFPKELSGGMKQRVGFARALVVEPEVLFMDEPFSALDVLTAENLRGELMELWLGKKIPTRAIFIVTHNIEEALLLADRIIVLGRNPGRIQADFEVDLAYPRDRAGGRFVELVDRIYKILTEKRSEAASPIPETKQEPQSAAAGGRYQPLPHARPGGIAGLLEILLAFNGRDDLYHLADELAMEVDDLLPIVEASSLVGFINVQEGDVELTPAGRAFVGADILTRKVLFREAALQHVPLLRQIESTLRIKPDHALDDEFFQDILDEHFTENEAKRQLRTAVHWGRYAEIFDYDAETHRLFVPQP